MRASIPTVAPPIVVLANPRTGTTMLRSILKEDPGLVDCSEPFNPALDRYYPTFWTFLATDWQPFEGWLPGAHPVDAPERAHQFHAYFDHLDALYPAQRKIVDLKVDQLLAVSHTHILPSDTPLVLQMLMERTAPVIFLSRANPLNEHASKLLALSLNTWVHHKDRDNREGRPAAEGRRIRLRLDDLQERLEGLQESGRLRDHWLGDYPKVARLKYESLLAGGELARAVRQELEDILGRRLDISGKPATRKAAPPLRQLIENFDEVREALAGTPYAWCTDEAAVETPETAGVAHATRGAQRVATPRNIVVIVGAERAGAQMLRATVAMGASATDLEEPFRPEPVAATTNTFAQFARDNAVPGPDEPAWSVQVAEEYLDRIERRLGGERALMGLRYVDLWALDATSAGEGPSELFRLLAARGYPMVHVVRRDPIAQYLSLQLALRSGRWVARGGSSVATTEPVQIDVADLRRYLDHLAGQKAMVAAWLAAVPGSVEIAYEDLVDDIRLSGKAASLMRGLGVPVPDGAYLTGSKIAPPVKSVVANLDEVLSALAETPDVAWASAGLAA